jgi:hypothetical protein
MEPWGVPQNAPPAAALPLQSPTNAASQLGTARAFSLHVTDGSLDDPSQYAKVGAHEVAVGQNVRVYLDDQESDKDLAPGLVQSIAELFDNELIPKFRSVFGSYRDVDGDGRFSILLSPWLARLQGGRTSVGGFVRGSDFQTHVAPPFSNRCDMMYVNSLTVPGPHLRTLLIHEYTHAISFSRRTGEEAGHSVFPEEEDWLNEALAHCAESLFGGGWTNLDYRISRYLNDTAAYPLVVEDYYRSGMWRCHGCRGATYLFLRYCVERFGTQILTQLIATPARGARNLELATGCPFDRLFRDWTLSLLDDSRLFDNSGTPDTKKRTKTGPTSCGEPPSGSLASLDLCGALGPWGLAGPRPQHWDLDSGPQRFELKGTSAAFVELSASRKLGVRRLHLAGTRGLHLQVSLVRIPDDAPQIEVEAAWAHRTSATSTPVPNSTTAGTADHVLRAAVRIVRGEGVTIEQIAAERNAGESRSSVCFCGEALKSVEVATNCPLDPNPLSGGELPPESARCRVFELAGEQFSNAKLPLILKVIAVDRRGRRVSGWATVGERAPQQVAAVIAIRR